MNRPEMDMSCKQARDLIDAYVDGEIELPEKTVLESHLVSCADCAEELAFARRVDAGLHALPAQKCPPSVSAAVFAYAASRPSPVRRPWWRLTPVLSLSNGWRPALTGAVAVILLLATAYVGQNGKQPTPSYSRAELEQAQQQAKWTMVFISQLSRKTASNLKHDVLDPYVVRKVMRIVDPKLHSAPKENEHAS